MSLSQETMLELMQYADGELDGAARARVEDLLGTSAEARGVVDAMGTLGEVVRAGIGERASGAEAADGIAEGVMAALAAGDADAAESRSGGKVVPLAPARAQGAPRRARPGALPAAVAFLALAAGVILFARSKGPAARHGDVFASAPPPMMSEPGPTSVASQGVAQAESRAVDLEEVRSIRNKVNVFFTAPAPSSKGASASVVVWIDDSQGGH